MMPCGTSSLFLSKSNVTLTLQKELLELISVIAIEKKTFIFLLIPLI